MSPDVSPDVSPVVHAAPLLQRSTDPLVPSRFAARWAVEEGLEEAAGQDDECSSKDGSGEASNDEPETQSWFRWAASAVGLH